MPVTVLVGTQWGDEGKGRVADWLARDADVMARYAGGDNAGHTVQVGDQEFKLHLVPSGVVHPNVRCILGSAMVVNPNRLVGELDMLASKGIDVSPDRIHLSLHAHIITPSHMALDSATDRARGSASIGTTQRGIGPAYMDKAARSGLLAGDMLHPEAFADQIRLTIERANELLTSRFAFEPLDADEFAAQYGAAAERLAPYVANTTAIIHKALQDGQRVLCEGAQGTLLDIDQGHYPYVTSSSATVGGALTGLGFGPREVTRVVGVAKAYCTRVGNGPFPTELTDAIGDQMRRAGAEFGTTTGRPRRCGWLDLVALRYAVQVNGLTELVLTKLDVLSGLDELRIATAYRLDGAETDTMPLYTPEMERAEAVYETLSGWQSDISGARHLADLPAAARAYVERIEQLAGVPVRMISVGPERDQAVQVTEG